MKCSTVSAESMTIRRLKQLCERLFRLPANQQAISVACPPDAAPRSLGHMDDASLASLGLEVLIFTTKLFDAFTRLL